MNIPSIRRPKIPARPIVARRSTEVIRTLGVRADAAAGAGAESCAMGEKTGERTAWEQLRIGGIVTGCPRLRDRAKDLGRTSRSVAFTRSGSASGSIGNASEKSRSRQGMEYIRIRGARTHNLKNVNLDLPRHRLIVVTGLSGSGKSSLAFDTLYAEGQRRYVESLSAYARQFLGQMEKPKYDHIRGLSPTIAIQQKSASSNPRSTVGTVTEIHDYLRLLYARIGEQHCPNCGGEVTARSAAEIVDELLTLPPRTKATLLARKADNRKGEFRDVFD